MPLGGCGSNHPPKPKPTEITEKDYEGFTEFLTTASIDRKTPWHKEMIGKYLSKKSGKK